jgi:hypothetical protein
LNSRGNPTTEASNSPVNTQNNRKRKAAFQVSKVMANKLASA